MLLVAFLLVNAPNCHLSLVLASVVQGDAVNCNTCHRQRAYSNFQTKTPCHFMTQSIKVISHVVHFQSEEKKSSVNFASSGIALLWLFFHLNCSVSGFAQLSHRVRVIALAVATRNLVEWKFPLCEWSSLGSQHCCFSSANRDNSFYGKAFYVSYRTFLISFQKQTQVYNLG